MIEARGLTKRYGDKLAVDDLSFTVRAGTVSGVGSAELGQRDGERPPLRRARRAVGEAGALLEARAVHTSRSAYHHLRALAATHGISRTRVDAVIELVGLQEVARRRAGGFSLGMGQRLAAPRRCSATRTR